MTRRIAAATAVLAMSATLLAGCGDDGAGAGEKPNFSESETPALWNPCDAIDAGLIKREFGTVAEEQTGTPTAPQCRFAPRKDSGQPAVEANYQLFPGGLDEAWDTMDIAKDADVTEPRIAGTDAARLVVNATRKSLGVTGFVQTGSLVQSVNVLAPAPYDRGRVVAGVTTVLTAFADHAGEAGVTPSASPGAPDSSGSPDSPH